MEVDDDRLVSVSRVHRGSTLELFKDRYMIELVLIPLHESKVIVGMDWLSPNRGKIDCEHRLVQI